MVLPDPQISPSLIKHVVLSCFMMTTQTLSTHQMLHTLRRSLTYKIALAI